MALTVNTNDPAGLLGKIKARIASRKIRTWACNAKGYFTHTPAQWRDQAWLKPVATRTSLRFLVILPPGDAKQGVAGVYQGRFAEMLQNHFGYSSVVSSSPDEDELDPATNSSDRRSTGARTSRAKTPRSGKKGKSAVS